MIGNRRRDVARRGHGRGRGATRGRDAGQATRAHPARKPYSPSIDLSSLSDRSNMDDSQFVTRVPLVDNVINRVKNTIKKLGTIEKRDENAQAVATLMSTAEKIHDAIETVRQNMEDAQSDIREAYNARDKRSLTAAAKRLKMAEAISSRLSTRLAVIENHITQHSFADLDSQYMEGVSMSNDILRNKLGASSSVDFDDIADDTMDNMKDAGERENHFAEMSTGIAESMENIASTASDDMSLVTDPSVMAALGLYPESAESAQDGDPFWANVEKMIGGQERRGIDDAPPVPKDQLPRKNDDYDSQFDSLVAEMDRIKTPSMRGRGKRGAYAASRRNY